MINNHAFPWLIIKELTDGVKITVFIQSFIASHICLTTVPVTKTCVERNIFLPRYETCQKPALYVWFFFQARRVEIDVAKKASMGDWPVLSSWANHKNQICLLIRIRYFVIILMIVVMKPPLPNREEIKTQRGVMTNYGLNHIEPTRRPAGCKELWYFLFQCYICHQFLQYFILHQLWIVDLLWRPSSK